MEGFAGRCIYSDTVTHPPATAHAWDGGIVLHFTHKGFNDDSVWGLRAIALDDSVRCVVICGGDGFFSAGADIKEMQQRGFEAIDNPARRAAWRAFPASRNH